METWKYQMLSLSIKTTLIKGLNLRFQYPWKKNSLNGQRSKMKKLNLSKNFLLYILMPIIPLYCPSGDKITFSGGEHHMIPFNHELLFHY